MKKSVLIIIACLCILSIVFIAFFGVAPAGIIPTIYIDSVSILDSTGQEIEAEEGKDKKMTIEYETNIIRDDTEYMQYFFSTRVLPSDCTQSLFDYSCPENQYVKVENSRNGALIIKKMKLESNTIPFFTTKITLKASDGGKAGIEDNLILTIKYDDMIIWE